MFHELNDLMNFRDLEIREFHTHLPNNMYKFKWNAALVYNIVSYKLSAEIMFCVGYLYKFINLSKQIIHNENQYIFFILYLCKVIIIG